MNIVCTIIANDQVRAMYELTALTAALRSAAARSFFCLASSYSGGSLKGEAGREELLDASPTAAKMLPSVSPDHLVR